LTTCSPLTLLFHLFGDYRFVLTIRGENVRAAFLNDHHAAKNAKNHENKKLCTPRNSEWILTITIKNAHIFFAVFYFTTKLLGTTDIPKLSGSSHPLIIFEQMLYKCVPISLFLQKWWDKICWIKKRKKKKRKNNFQNRCIAIIVLLRL